MKRSMLEEPPFAWWFYLNFDPDVKTPYVTVISKGFVSYDYSNLKKTYLPRKNNSLHPKDSQHQLSGHFGRRKESLSFLNPPAVQVRRWEPNPKEKKMLYEYGDDTMCDPWQISLRLEN